MDDIDEKIDDVSKRNSSEADEIEKTLFKYVIFGSAASMLFILNFYKDGFENKTFNDFLDLELVLFATSLVLAIIGMFLSMHIRVGTSKLLNETLKIELDKQEIGVPSEANVEECSQLIARSKENIKKLKRHGKLHDRTTNSFMLLSGIIFLIAFILVIHSVVRL